MVFFLLTRYHVARSNKERMKQRTTSDKTNLRISFFSKQTTSLRKKKKQGNKTQNKEEKQ